VFGAALFGDVEIVGDQLHRVITLPGVQAAQRPVRLGSPRSVACNPVVADLETHGVSSSIPVRL
jgi:hypothetical protein